MTELTLDDARKLYEKFAAKDGDEAVRAMADIALAAKRQQTGWGRLRLEALRVLGRFLIRNGARQGRPLKTSSADVLPTLARLGITDRHISADAKSVGRISQKDFRAYLVQEDEPTLKGLLRFAERARIGQPYPSGNPAFPLANTQSKRSFLDTDAETSTVEWYTPSEIFHPAKLRNPSRCSGVTSIRDRPGITAPTYGSSGSGFCHMWIDRENLA
jgi:hypothetical protein